MTTPSPEGAAAAPRRPGMAARVLEWRLPAIDTWPRVVAFAQTFAGRLVLFLVFAGLMKLIAPGMWIGQHRIWLLMTVAAAIVSMAGRHRDIALLFSTVAALVYFPGWFDFGAVQETIRQERLSGTVDAGSLRTWTLIAYFLLAALAIHLARRYRDHPLGRRPVLAQHIVFCLLLGFAVSHLLRGLPQVLLWSMTTIFTTYFWYLAYALMDQRHRHPEPPDFHLATFSPFFFSTVIPMGKGAANWRSVEAGTAEALAVTQLKAIKLLVWALVLKHLLLAYNWVVYDQLRVQPLRLAFERFLGGGDVSGPSGLLTLVANFPEKLFVVAVGGHVAIAVARLAGFRLLRNTYRPLSSRTIAEFWNRYFYYFKEILVHVYFYPTYLRWFKRHPRLRIAFATFMAAGFGNFLFHFMENHTIVKLGLIEALTRSQTYAFYCVVLSAGIIASQLRGHRPPADAGWLRGQLLPSLGVAAFFSVLLVFDSPYRHLTLVQHFEFLYRVFSISGWIRATG